MKTVAIKCTFYSGKLWHSEKPFPVKPEIFDSANAFSVYAMSVNAWLSTAYEVVNPEVIPTLEMFDKSLCRKIAKGLIALVDGDQITLPEGYGIKYTLSGRIEFKEVGHSEATTKTATIITPEKPENNTTDKEILEKFTITRK